ncbi:hypothetical protein BTS2_3159 [Bacillus sp. TS-2]|nr:hypothetical protein BTS2_3159 [Bacillus sp. TS-2]
MKRKASTLLPLLFVISVFIFFIFYFTTYSLKETLTYFPPHPQLSYAEAFTNLELESVIDENQYKLKWTTQSLLEQNAYLRQDVSLLFEDGYLKDIQSTWKENTEAIIQTKEVKGEDIGQYRSITFHHAEIHQDNQPITSVQTLSSTYLYLIDSPLKKISAFKNPNNLEEKETKRTIDYLVDERQKIELKSLLETFQLNSDDFQIISLTDLPLYEDEGYPYIDKEKTSQFLGGLWEGLYQEYVLSIEKEDGSLISPIGSTTPYILFSKEAKEVLILLRTADGEPILLKQTLS